MKVLVVLACLCVAIHSLPLGHIFLLDLPIDSEQRADILTAAEVHKNLERLIANGLKLKHDTRRGGPLPPYWG
ncbi:hypothetical protein Ciccas_008729 [Cichlidogyrus casuarinus]|uniref:Uncharacterized protein n=1 Tax=Cichlidogyrus casuarinus TaxID=1844966 RepID=A0ABD2PZ67_9PLAT